MTHFNMRAVPVNFPAEAELAIHETEFFDRRRGETKVQWQGIYLPPGGSHRRDLSNVVVNFCRDQEPHVGDVWRVRFTNRAPKMEIVFADALELVHREVPKVADTEIETVEVEAIEHERCKCVVRAWMTGAVERLRQRFG